MSSRRGAQGRRRLCGSDCHLRGPRVSKDGGNENSIGCGDCQSHRLSHCHWSSCWWHCKDT